MITMEEKNNNFFSYICKLLCLVTRFTALLKAKRSSSYDNKCLSQCSESTFLPKSLVIISGLTREQRLVIWPPFILNYLRQQGDAELVMELMLFIMAPPQVTRYYCVVYC